jgi:predicted  nucleic acid-binding Zn-ribbon protein
MKAKAGNIRNRFRTAKAAENAAGRQRLLNTFAAKTSREVQKRQNRETKQLIGENVADLEGQYNDLLNQLQASGEMANNTPGLQERREGLQQQIDALRQKLTERRKNLYAIEANVNAAEKENAAANKAAANKSKGIVARMKNKASGLFSRKGNAGSRPSLLSRLTRRTGNKNALRGQLLERSLEVLNELPQLENLEKQVRQLQQAVREHCNGRISGVKLPAPIRNNNTVSNNGRSTGDASTGSRSNNLSSNSGSNNGSNNGSNGGNEANPLAGVGNVFNAAGANNRPKNPLAGVGNVFNAAGANNRPKNPLAGVGNVFNAAGANNRPKNPLAGVGNVFNAAGNNKAAARINNYGAEVGNLFSGAPNAPAGPVNIARGRSNVAPRRINEYGANVGNLFSGAPNAPKNVPFPANMSRSANKGLSEALTKSNPMTSRNANLEAFKARKAAEDSLGGISTNLFSSAPNAPKAKNAPFPENMNRSANEALSRSLTRSNPMTNRNANLEAFKARKRSESLGSTASAPAPSAAPLGRNAAQRMAAVEQELKRQAAEQKKAGTALTRNQLTVEEEQRLKNMMNLNDKITEKNALTMIGQNRARNMKGGKKPSRKLSRKSKKSSRKNRK